jgi:uncharacterized phage protein (TIGR01671 family)
MGIGGVMIEDRFKFRFYDKDKKIMIDENSDTKYIANIYGRDEWYWCIEAQMPKILSYFDGEGFVEGKWHKFNFAIMQCTGLKDKNGKLIYEGDILYNPFSNYKYVVNYGKFALNYTKPFSVNITGFYITYKENIKNEVDSLQMLDLNNIEVIGNVYQNPELLED